MATSLPSFTLGPFHLNCKLWAVWVDGKRERETGMNKSRVLMRAGFVSFLSAGSPDECGNTAGLTRHAPLTSHRNIYEEHNLTTFSQRHMQCCITEARKDTVPLKNIQSCLIYVPWLIVFFVSVMPVGLNSVCLLEGDSCTNMSGSLFIPKLILDEKWHLRKRSLYLKIIRVFFSLFLFFFALQCKISS